MIELLYESKSGERIPSDSSPILSLVICPKKLLNLMTINKQNKADENKKTFLIVIRSLRLKFIFKIDSKGIKTKQQK